MEKTIYGRERMPGPASSLDWVLILGNLANSPDTRLAVDQLGALHGGLLTESESDKLKAVAQVINHAEVTFGKDRVRAWLHKPFIRFQQRSPLQVLIEAGGVEKIQEYLASVDEGYFA